LMLPVWLEWCHTYYTFFYIRIGMWILWSNYWKNVMIQVGLHCNLCLQN
jgi:hypothetical protein